MSIKTYIRSRPRKGGEESYEITVDHGFFDVLQDDQVVSKRIRTTKTIRGTKVQAEIYAAQLAAMAEGKDPFASPKKQRRMTLQDWNKVFLRDHTPNIEESTRAGYRTNLSYFEASPVGKIALDHLSNRTLQQFFDSLLTESPKGTGAPLSPRTIRHIHSALHLSLAEAVRAGFIPQNPAESIRLPKRGSFEAQHYEAEELQKILEAASGEKLRKKLLISLYVCTGMRRGEGCGLRFSDVDFQKCQLRVRNNRVRGEDGEVVEKRPKSVHGNRVITVPASLITLIKEEQRRRLSKGLPAVYVLGGKNGEAFAPDTVSRYWRTFLQKHPEIRPLRLHDLRHSQMCLLLEQGVTPAVAAARLGDTTATAMNAYAHSSSLKEARAGALVEKALCG